MSAQHFDERAALHAEITVRELRWILTFAPGDATLAEARAEFVESERRAVADAAHAELQRAYSEYIDRRREREREQVESAAAAAGDETIHSHPTISRERVALIRKEAAELARLRHEVLEPRLEFDEWMDAGQPAVHRTGGAPRGLKAKLTERR
jgi:hypothetical protein